MNSKVNDTPFNDTSTDSDFVTTPADIAIAVSLIDGLSILFGATINLAVIITIARYRYTLKTMDLLILNLCLSDFVSSTIYQPLVISRLMARSELSLIHVKFLKWATSTCLLSDCAALFLVTFDKYLGARFPFGYHLYFNQQKVLVIIACVWFTAIAIGLTFALYDSASRIAGILYAVLVLLMFIITTVLQIATFFIAKRQEKRIRQLGEAVNHNRAAMSIKIDRKNLEVVQRQDAQIELGVAQSSMNNLKPVNPFTNKAARTITLLTTVFIISWLPQIVLNVYFIITLDRTTFHSLIYLFVAFQQLHVCINPFIYVFRTKYIHDKFFGRRNDIGGSSTTHK